MATLAQFLATLRNDVRLAVVLPVKVISNEIGVERGSSRWPE